MAMAGAYPTSLCTDSTVLRQVSRARSPFLEGARQCQTGESNTTETRAFLMHKAQVLKQLPQHDRILEEAKVILCANAPLEPSFL